MLAAVGYCGLDPSAHAGFQIPKRVNVERKISKICKKCFAFDPQKRPSMPQILERVDNLRRATVKETFDHIQSLLQ
jgi:hypothetical protein